MKTLLPPNATVLERAADLALRSAIQAIPKSRLNCSTGFAGVSRAPRAHASGPQGPASLPERRLLDRSPQRSGSGERVQRRSAPRMTETAGSSLTAPCAMAMGGAVSGGRVQILSSRLKYRLRDIPAVRMLLRIMSRPTSAYFGTMTGRRTPGLLSTTCEPVVRSCVKPSANQCA